MSTTNRPRAVLELQQVSRSYGAGETLVQALIEADLTVNAGEFVAVMGPSGSGKSTLLTIAGTLEQPSSGVVLINGADAGDLSLNDRARLRRRSIGYVFQSFNLLAGLTAVENVALPLELDGTRARAARCAAGETLDRLGLGHRAEHFPDQLSGGESQRVAIARAVVGQRQLLLADEPTGNLDETTGGSVFDILLRLARETGTGLLIATHSERLSAAADRRLHLSHGRITA